MSAYDPQYQESDIIDEIVQSMSARDKVAQLLIVGFEGPEAEGEASEFISEHAVGGVYLSRELCNINNGPAYDPEHCGFSADSDVDTPAQVSRLTEGLQAVSCTATEGSAGGTEYCLPLFVAVDHEGDDRSLTRLLNGFTPIPSNMAIGATFDPQEAETVGCIVGRELAAVGVNMLLGPTLDVLDSPRSGGPGDQGIRTFGGDPQWVAEMAASYVQGLHECGEGRVAAVVKHFPGHGRSTRGVDYEDIPVIVGKPLEELADEDLAPFRAVTQGDVGDTGVTDAMMNSHLSYPEVPGCDAQTPVTFSPTCMESFTGLEDFASWRADGGLTLADDLAAGAVVAYAQQKFGTYLQAVIVEEALMAGNDVLPLIRPWQWQDVPPTLDYLVSRYEADAQVRARVDDAVRRVLELKYRLYSGLTPLLVTSGTDDQADVGSAEYLAAVSSLAAKSVTFIRPDTAEEFRQTVGAPSVGERILFVECWDDPYCAPPGPADAEGYPPLWPSGKLASLAEEMFPGRVSPETMRTISFSQLGEVLRGDADEELKGGVEDADWIVFAFLERDPANFPASEVLKDFLGRGPALFDLRAKNVVVFAYNSPYHLDAGELRNVDLFVALYTKIEPALRVSLRLLFHDPTILREIGAGRLPVDYIYGDLALYDLSEQVKPDPSQTIGLAIEPDPPSPGEEFAVALAGPLLARNGHRVANGTSVRFSLVLPGGETREVEAVTTDGVAQAELTSPVAGDIAVRVSSGSTEWSTDPIAIPDRAETPAEGDDESATPVAFIASVAGAAALAVAVVLAGFVLYRRRSRAVPAGMAADTPGAAQSPIEPPAGAELRVDTETHRVLVRDAEIQPPLSREQFELLAYLFENAGRLCTRDEIIDRVWPGIDAAGVSDRAVDSLVHRIRERLRSAGASKDFIVTVRGQGFRLEL